MSNTIYLYLKTHNKTRLQYFGMTKQNPCQYMGSGKRWRNHLSKHGNDVTTEVIFESEDKDEITEVGKHYSRLWNIVASSEFANLKIEEGDGGFDHINDGSENHRERCRKASSMVKNRNPGRKFTSETAGLSFLGKQHTEETKKKISEANKVNQKGEKNSNYGSVWCVKIHDVNYKDRKMFKPNEIPEGWISCVEHRELRKQKTNSAYNRSWYNDGKKNYFLKRDDPKIGELGLEKRRISFEL
jgi:hypothetical protein